MIRLLRLFLVLVGAGVMAGCANPGAAERADSAHTFETNLIAETERVLARTGPTLSLTQAVNLARERSLKLTEQDLARKLAEVNRATAFSAFLPTVAFTGQSTLFSGDLSNAPLVGSMTGEGLNLNAGSLLVAQPVFTPVAWIMFAEAQYGVRIREIVRQRAQQLLDVQVAARFCSAAVAERMVGVYERHFASGCALTNRLTMLTAEGYALENDLVRARARCAAHAFALAKARSDGHQARAALADLLFLWPLASFTVDGDTLLAIPPPEEKSIEEWIWQGLVSRKDLAAGDQTLALRKARVVEALAGFLPNVVLGGGGANLSLESVAVKGWAGSLMGTWAAFEGFRTVQQYRAARAEREAEFKLQEDRMLSVVVAVANAWRNWTTVREQRTAAKVWAEAAALDCQATEKRFESGQETFSTVLDKIAVRDEAEVKNTQAAYAEALAVLMLHQAVGSDYELVMSDE